MYDHQLTEDAIEHYLASVSPVDRQVAGTKLIGDKGPLPLKPIGTDRPMTVASLQQILSDRGFLPGGTIDGICGYRTHSAIRLFQEYVRAIEGMACLPDGIAGPKTMAHLTRWVNNDLRANWLPTLKAWEDKSLAAEDTEFNQWLGLFSNVKAAYQAEPSPMLKLVNGYAGASDTIKVDDWDFSPDDIHLVGIRYRPDKATHKFDDILTLLIKGLCFKFQGSTDPGHTTNKKGAPFLVQGQHDFQFGLHKSSYHALRPESYDQHGLGVLVVRSKGDFRLTDDDLKRGLEANGTINIHWGGKGVGRAVNRWSEGCQIIAGSAYENHENKIIECSSYVAINNGEVKDKSKNKTRGAYNVLTDIIGAFSSDMRLANRVKYMLLLEEDLDLHDGIKSIMREARVDARRLLNKLS